MEKIIHFLFHREKKGEEVIQEAVLSGDAAEKTKIKSAITTDFILSVEIVIIALGTVLEQAVVVQVLTVVVVALLATVGVYGIVAIIIRMDDVGHRLIKRSGDTGVMAKLGHLLVKSLPIIIKALGVIGTIALLLVSGGIFVHNVDFFHHLFPSIPVMLKELLFGIVVGLIAVMLMALAKLLFARDKEKN